MLNFSKITVLQASWETPINARHGFYVQVRIDTAGLESMDGFAALRADALQVAANEAAAAGYSTLFNVGMPVSHAGFVTLATWFAV